MTAWKEDKIRKITEAQVRRVLKKMGIKPTKAKLLKRKKRKKILLQEEHMRVFDEKTGKMINVKASPEMEKWAKLAKEQQRKLLGDQEYFRGHEKEREE